MATTGVYKRGETYWIRYTDIHGKECRESSGSKKYADAVAKLTERRKSVKDGKEVDQESRIGKHTFGQLVEKYLPFCESLKGFGKKKSVIKLLDDEFHATPLRNFSVSVLEQYQARLRKEEYAPATVNKRLVILRHMMKKAVDWQMLAPFVLERAKRVTLQKEDGSRLRYLQWEEAQRLLECCTDHLRPIVFTALNTGMRRGEILNLRWEQVDLKNGFIFLGQKDTKTSKRREIPITDSLRAVLCALPRKDGCPWVFPSPRPPKPPKTEVWPTTEVKTAFASARKRAGIVDFRFHDLRHTFASHLVMGGCDITTVSKLLGHANLTMTLRYAHLAPNHLSSAVGILSGRFDKPAIETTAIAALPASKIKSFKKKSAQYRQ